MNNKDLFRTWLIGARKQDGERYKESTKQSYFNVLCNAQKAFPSVWDLGSAEFQDATSSITGSKYYFNLPQSRRYELDAVLALYKEFLCDRENGWRTIAEFSEGKQFDYTSKFSLHVTYDEPFTVKGLSGFLNEFDASFKDMLTEQGYSPSEAEKADMTVVKIKEGSLWFEIVSLAIQIAVPILGFVLDRYKKSGGKNSVHCDGDKQIDIDVKNNK